MESRVPILGRESMTRGGEWEGGLGGVERGGDLDAWAWWEGMRWRMEGGLWCVVKGRGEDGREERVGLVQ